MHSKLKQQKKTTIKQMYILEIKQKKMENKTNNIYYIKNNNNK